MIYGLIEISEDYYPSFFLFSMWTIFVQGATILPFSAACLINIFEFLQNLKVFFFVIKQRYSAPENINGYKEEICPVPDNEGRLGLSIEDAAATRIQTAYRSYLVCHVPCYYIFFFVKLSQPIYVICFVPWSSRLTELG